MLKRNIFSQENIINYCQGKSWVIRFPLLLFFVYIFVQHLNNPNYFGLLGGFDLLVHEAGHFLFMFFGETMHILGGTLTQLAIPVICLIAFASENELFGISFCLVWLADNLFGVAVYIADARARELPLLGGNAVGHDWYALLSKWGIINYDIFIGGIIRFVATIIMAFAIGFSAMLLWEMYKNRNNKSAIKMADNL